MAIAMKEDDDLTGKTIRELTESGKYNVNVIPKNVGSVKTPIATSDILEPFSNPTKALGKVLTPVNRVLTDVRSAVENPVRATVSALTGRNVPQRKYWATSPEGYVGDWAGAAKGGFNKVADWMGAPPATALPATTLPATIPLPSNAISTSKGQVSPTAPISEPLPSTPEERVSSALQRTINYFRGALTGRSPDPNAPIMAGTGEDLAGVYGSKSDEPSTWEDTRNIAVRNTAYWEGRGRREDATAQNRGVEDIQNRLQGIVMELSDRLANPQGSFSGTTWKRGIKDKKERADVTTALGNAMQALATSGATTGAGTRSLADIQKSVADIMGRETEKAALPSQIGERGALAGKYGAEAEEIRKKTGAAPSTFEETKALKALEHPPTSGKDPMVEWFTEWTKGQFGAPEEGQDPTEYYTKQGKQARTLWDAFIQSRKETGTAGKTSSGNRFTVKEKK